MVLIKDMVMEHVHTWMAVFMKEIGNLMKNKVKVLYSL
jgi:hypothetical protein